MNLVYFGTAPFAVPALQALAPDVVLVASQPDRPTGRGMKLQPSPVKLAAQVLGLPVETPEKCRAPEFVERIKLLEADVLVVAAYGQILSVPLLEAAKRGGINLHGSILPAYRGAAPIQRSILHGDEETGVTLMQMEKGMDTGDVIEIAKTPIGPDETYGELAERLAEIAADLATRWMPRIVTGDYPRAGQDHSAATHAPKVERSEAELSVLRRAKDEYNRFRAFSPAPGAFIKLPDGPLKVTMARFDPSDREPGTIALDGDGMLVGFDSASIRLLEVQPPGKKRMDARSYANGARLRTGMRLV